MENTSAEHFGRVHRNDKYEWTALYECKYCYTIFEALERNVRSGNTKSCGCLRHKARASHHHGRAAKRKSHGMSGTRTYRAWAMMRQMCDNPKHTSYWAYGAQGISYPPSWASFSFFYEDMGTCPSENHELHRIDTNIGYSVENCHWELKAFK